MRESLGMGPLVSVKLDVRGRGIDGEQRCHRCRGLLVATSMWGKVVSAPFVYP
jgi:hypothetical protein